MPAHDADPSDEGRAHAGLILRLIDHLPVGLSIRDEATGDCVYANAEARRATLAHQRTEAEAPLHEIRDQAVEIDGRRFSLSVAIDVTDQRAREQKLAERAFFDDLTGLPKSDLMQEAIEAMTRAERRPFALAFIDVDNFKYINDYYGHAIGDKLLKKIAERIAAHARPTDLVARVGGDEFIFLTVPIPTAFGPVPEIERLSARFKDPFYIDGYEIFTSASIGVSFYPAHGETYDVLRANADSAMYRIKSTAKGGLKFFDAGLNAAATLRMEEEQRLRLAVRDTRICCAFQPKIDFRDERIVGLEVLLRWRDEDGGVHGPGDFVRLAVELGLMNQITMIMLQQVADQFELIDDAFGAAPSISLNVAPAQAADLAFMVSLIEAIKHTGRPSRFILELTEEALLAQGDFRDRVLPLLREASIGVSIDDFGVGYSSLATLAEITADELKVDRSFITGIDHKPRNQSILKMIELLGSALGMRIVVEGVETIEELDYIRSATQIACAQGFYLAKPMLLQDDPSTLMTVRSARAARLQRPGAPSRTLGRRC